MQGLTQVTGALRARWVQQEAADYTHRRSANATHVWTEGSWVCGLQALLRALTFSCSCMTKLTASDRLRSEGRRCSKSTQQQEHTA